MRYDLWEPKRRIELNYRLSLRGLIQKINEMINGKTDPFEIVEIIRLTVLTPIFQKYAEAAASKMVTSLFNDAGRTWRTAARENARGKELYRALQNELQGPVGSAVFAEIFNNAQLIKTLPIDIAESVNQYIKTRQNDGIRASDISEEIKRMFPEKSEARADLIARTEVSKVNTALTHARCVNLGIQWYIWRTERDARVRLSHRKMEGVLVNWDDPPSPEELSGEKSYGRYHAGNIFNCRCYPEPVTRTDLVEFPHKVYNNGRIVRMTRAKFERMMA
jgi:SPP1 gp7 family putative phage head morphogenesis protein